METGKIRMRKSNVMRKLRAGETVLCTKLSLSDSRVVEIAALMGFDCIWTDMEHVANDWFVIEKQILAAKAYGIDAVVRVGRGSYSDLIRPLELDAAGIMVPHVMNVADAEKVIRMTKFHPVGRRPVDGGNADGAFCNISVNDYLSQANAQRFTILQIEDPEALEEVEQIAALPGVDMLFFGPGDYSHALGIPGQYTDPRITEARYRIASAAAAHNVFAGTVGGVQDAVALVDSGYQFINVGGDVVGLSEYYGQLVRELTGTGRSSASRGLYGGGLG